MKYDVNNEISNSKGEMIETLADIEELQPVDVDSETEIILRYRVREWEELMIRVKVRV